MKKVNHPGIAVLALLTSFFLTNCTNPDASRVFKTREDSVAFAKKVMEAYPQMPEFAVSDTGCPGPKAIQGFSEKQWARVPWLTIQRFAARHDASPLLTQGGTVIKGFMIDESGLGDLRSLPATKRKLYLRFGIDTTNNKYTIMILPVDAANNVEMRDAVNFDHLDPCPSICPANFQ